MKNIKLWLTAVAAVSLVSLSTIAQTTTAPKAEPNVRLHEHNTDSKDDSGPMGHRHNRRDHLPRDAGLELTDTQKKTLADARAAQEPAMYELREKLGAARKALVEAGDTNADDVRLATLANNLAQLIAQQELVRVKMHKQLIDVLTPEQKQKLEAFKAEHKNPPRWKDKHKEAH